jgi:hypothetical protein
MRPQGAFNRRERTVTNDELEALLPEWQKRLRLEDWDIALEFEKHAEGLGNVRMAAKYKSAVIVILEEGFIDPDALGNKDREVTLVDGSRWRLYLRGGKTGRRRLRT